MGPYGSRLYYGTYYVPETLNPQHKTIDLAMRLCLEGPQNPTMARDDCNKGLYRDNGK